MKKREISPVWSSTTNLTPEESDNYLKPTRLSDSDHPSLQAKARELTVGAGSDKEAALRIFYFVRDHIKFGSSDLFGQASHTYRVGIGDCGIKSNVQMSLLRAAGIPARLHAITAKREVINGLFPAWAVAMFPQEAGHIYCECCLSDRWIACEATFDVTLFKALLRTGILPQGVIPTIDWDGEMDLTLIHPWMIRDLGVCTSYEEGIAAFEDIEGRGGYPTGFLPELFYKLFGWAVNISVNRQLDRIRGAS